MKPVRVGIISVAPSPYQRDFFRALAARSEVDIHVFYQERETHDSPWPVAALAPYESILPGLCWKWGRVRCHWNWNLPDPADFDIWIVNAGLTSVTTQWLLRWKLRNCPWLFWAERLRPQPSACERWMQQVLAAPLQNAVGILSIGSLALDDYQRRFPQPLQANVPYCTELAPFFEAGRKRGARGTGITFLFCGQMIERKGVDLLLKAFDRLVAEGRDIRLRLVGREGHLPQWLAGLSSGTRERIRYEGFQVPDDLPACYVDADVFILPSRHDGWGVVVNQAMASGLPVLCSDAVGAGRDFVQPHRNGIVFKANDPDAIYEAMREVVENSSLLPVWGAESARLVEALTPQAGAQRMVNVIKAFQK